VHVDTKSRFIGWEINCLGLPARSEPFETGSLRLDLELWRSSAISDPHPIRSGPISQEMGSVPIFIDRIRLKGESDARGARWGLAGQEAVGTLLATPATREDVESIRELVSNEPLAAVSLVDGVLVLRSLAPQAEAVRNLFISAWQRLRPRIIGRDAVLPRIWAT
jgi:urease accessory protein